MTRSLVSVQRAGKVDKIIHPVNGHPGKLLAAKVCRKLFLRVEKEFQTLGTVWGSMSHQGEKSGWDEPKLSLEWGLGYKPPKMRPVKVWNARGGPDLNPSQYNMRVTVGTLTRHLGQGMSK